MKKCFFTFLIFVLSLFVIGCAGKNVSQNDGNQKENSKEVSDPTPTAGRRPGRILWTQRIAMII